MIFWRAKPAGSREKTNRGWVKYGLTILKIYIAMNAIAGGRDRIPVEPKTDGS